MAGIEAELKQAIHEMHGRTVEHDFAARRLAELESERLQWQADLLVHRRSHLEIRSPIDGMVISGDWRQSEGMPLSRGEKLFEIAPTTQMIFEIHVPENEIQYVRAGMIVTMSPHASPSPGRSGHRWAGRITHIHPRAELRDHDNGFIAEVLVVNQDDVLQPGMRGRATIYSDKRTIGWSLFHKPWFAMRTMMGL